MTIVRVLTSLSILSLLSGCASQSTDEESTNADTATVSTSTPEQDGWRLVWSDEFSGSAIDTTKWGFDVDCWGGGNEERQCYTDRTENASILDGNLVITARKESFTGPALPLSQRAAATDPDATATKPFTSARLVTRGKSSWKYGRIDVRAKLPQGQGTWPAIWMLPEDWAYGGWAASGEIDILEAVNMGVTCKKCPGGVENTILGTLHFGGVTPNNKLASTEVPLPGSLDAFHIYSIIWRKGHFTWLVDGKPFATKSANDWSTTSSDDPNVPFDKPFHLILNLAIGGGLPEDRGLKGVSEEGFPKRFEVDYVRVWKCNAETASTQSCNATGDN